MVEQLGFSAGNEVSVCLPKECPLCLDEVDSWDVQTAAQRRLQ